MRESLMRRTLSPRVLLMMLVLLAGWPLGLLIGTLIVGEHLELRWLLFPATVGFLAALYGGMVYSFRMRREEMLAALVLAFVLGRGLGPLLLPRLLGQ